MDNLIKIFESNQLNKLIENTEKLLILMFYTKTDPECKRALQFFEKNISNNTFSLFGLIDIDQYTGSSSYVKNINTLPAFYFFFQKKLIGNYQTSSEKGIQQVIKIAEEYVISFLNNKSQPNIQYESEPKYQPQTQPQQSQYQHQYQPQYQPQPQPQPQPQYQPQPQQSQIFNQMLNQIPQNQEWIPPTYQQMQQMFQIFQMMYQMGVLNMSPNNKEEEKILPNGDKLIQLSDGKFGLIKNKINK